ncbi:MAG: hypothetical protein WBA29_09470 [Xanthobacteraceae bacterium]
MMCFAETLERWRTRRALAGELDMLSRDQRVALARDAGVSAAAFGRIAAAGERGHELERLMAALSLDATASGFAKSGAVARDMGRVCAECAMVKRCRRELKAGTAPDAYNDYCPNALTLDALVATQANARLIARNRDRRV